MPTSTVDNRGQTLSDLGTDPEVSPHFHVTAQACSAWAVS